MYKVWWLCLKQPVISLYYVNNGFWFARAMSILSRSEKHLPKVANCLSSGAGFWELNNAGFSFCVDAINGARQCSVLQVISSDIGGIIYRQPCCAGLGCWFLSCYGGCCIKCFKFSQGAAYNYYFLHIFTETKILLCSTRFEHVGYDST